MGVGLLVFLRENNDGQLPKFAVPKDTKFNPEVSLPSLLRGMIFGRVSTVLKIQLNRQGASLF